MATASQREVAKRRWQHGSSFEFTRRLGLDPCDARTRTRSIVALVLLAYLPIALLALLGWLRGGAIEAWFLRAEVHARLLGALGLVLAAEAMLELRVDVVIRGVVADGVLPESRHDPWLGDSPYAWATRLFVAVWLAVIYTALLSAYFGTLPTWAERWLLHGRDLGTIDASAAWWWYAAFAQPLLLLLLGRWLFRWCLWAALLWRLARLDPKLYAAHVDRAGGLGFTRLPLDALRVYVLGLGVAIAAVWFDEIAVGQAVVATFTSDLLGFLLGVVAIALLPYAAFTKLLVRERHRGALRYTALLRRYLEAFERRWLDGSGQADAELLGSPDMSGLADLGASAAVVGETRATILSGADLRSLLIVAVIPFVLVALAYGPSTAELVRAVISRFFAG